MNTTPPQGEIYSPHLVVTEHLADALGGIHTFENDSEVFIGVVHPERLNEEIHNFYTSRGYTLKNTEQVAKLTPEDTKYSLTYEFEPGNSDTISIEKLSPYTLAITRDRSFWHSNKTQKIPCSNQVQLKK
ncbi:MAG: hypothetical protein AABX11_03025 [Nanoarchaeota archaeon]